LVLRRLVALATQQISIISGLQSAQWRAPEVEDAAQHEILHAEPLWQLSWLLCSAYPEDPCHLKPSQISRSNYTIQRPQPAHFCHCDSRSDAAISKRTAKLQEIASLRSQ
jgi:hypothetical protein